jgi:hypothetical protein
MTAAKMRHPRLRLHKYPADPTGGRYSHEHIARAADNPQSGIQNPRSKRALWLGFAGSLLARLLGRRLPPVTGADLKRHDYPTSTQRMGVRFTKRIRDTFRFRWLRKMP